MAMTGDSTKTIKTLLLFALVFALLFIAQKFLIPFTFGIVLAMLFMPMCQWLEKHKVPKSISVLLCIAVILLVFTGIGLVLSWQITELAKDGPQIKENLTTIVTKANQFVVDKLGIPQAKQYEMLKQQQQYIPANATKWLSMFGGVFIDCILALVYIALMLYYRSHLKNFILKVIPAHQRDESKEVIYNAAKVSQQYLLGLAKMIACLWIMYSIAFSIVGVKNVFFFAFLCGLLEIIPFIGNLTGSAITVLVAIAQGGQPAIIVGIIVSYAIVQFLQSWVLEPFVVGPQVKINPLFTIVVLVIGELMWGVSGMVLAIPITGILKIVFDHVEPLKPYGFLIGETPEASAEKPMMVKIKNWFAGHFAKR